MLSKILNYKHINREADKSLPSIYSPLYISLLLQIRDNTRTRDFLSFSFTPTRIYIPAHRIRKQP